MSVLPPERLSRAERIVDDVAARAADQIIERIGREHLDLKLDERRELKWLLMTLVGRRLQIAARERDMHVVLHPKEHRARAVRERDGAGNGGRSVP